MKNDDNEENDSNYAFSMEKTESSASNNLSKSMMALRKKINQETFFDCHPTTNLINQEELSRVKMVKCHLIHQ